MHPVEQTVVVQSLGPDELAAFQQWYAEVRQRRPEFGASRRAARVSSHVSWVEPRQGVVVVRIEAGSLDRAHRTLASSTDPFDNWYQEQEQRFFGSPLLDPARPRAEALIQYHTDHTSELDLFIAIVAPVVPGSVDYFRSRVTDRTRYVEGLARVRRWGLSRLDIWLQTAEDTTWAVYDVAGDITGMMNELATSQGEDMVQQRDFVAEVFGVDLTRETLAVPLASFSWSA